MSGVQQRVVGADEADMRFDRWCRKHFPSVAHVQLQKLLRTGQFRLDGKRLVASTRVRTGQTVRVPPLDTAALPPRPTVDPRDAKELRRMIIHEDEHVIVLNKPPGLAVQGGSKTTRHVDGMLDVLARDGERPRLVHRLDRDTSGILVLARTAVVARQLMHAFQGHAVQKLYWAIVLGKPDRESGLIDLALGKSGAPGRERMTADGLDAKNARTNYRLIARSGKIGAWVGLMPLTGRTHQLRAHMAAVGTPILGDAKYGASARSTAPPGLMLHAREVHLPLAGRKPLSIAADPPKSFTAGLAWLGLGPERLPYTAIADWDVAP
ncbi:MAG: RluA family pseudouridine synthase [Geminicoccaceae bacterium]|nr:RluA family pseudouridine synthase [Geminicoccaceae bacterium]